MSDACRHAMNDSDHTHPCSDSWPRCVEQGTQLVLWLMILDRDFTKSRCVPHVEQGLLFARCCDV